MRSFSPAQLYLTATGRLARRLRHEHRMMNLNRGGNGWEALNALSLNDWLQVKWSESWPEETPAHFLHRLRLFKELSHDCPPPASIEIDLQLCKMLDDAYAMLIRHNLDPCSGPPSTPLVEWRRQMSSRFKNYLASMGHFHPAELPSKIARNIEKGILTCPNRIEISGFDFPAPVEMNLFRILSEKVSVTEMNFHGRMPDHLEAVALPSPEQEILYLVHRIVEDARSIPLNRIGVVVPDLDAYADLLENCLISLTGKSQRSDSVWYNISLGKAVLSFPLIRAALLPLQMVLEGTTRENLLALFLSPYYRWGSVQTISRADLVWRKCQAESGLKELLDSLRGNDPEILNGMDNRHIQYLCNFADLDFSVKRPLSFWLKELENLWLTLDFPVLTDEKDSIAAHHLTAILKEMRAHVGGLSINGFDLLSWLHFLAAGEISQTGTPEEAGIQVLGLIESRGHAFERLYVLGMSDRSLPQPVRPLPFLDAEERKKVLGGTPQSQYTFADKSFKRLLSSSPIITLLRPEHVDLEPLSPSPFWPVPETKRYIDLWNDPGPSWLRAGWLRSAFDGLYISAPERHETCRTFPALERKNPSFGTSRPPLLPGTLSVSDFEKAVTCPFLFFLEAILGIEPLKDPLTSVYPMERGERLHRVLSLFTREARKKRLFPDMERQEAVRLLTGCVDRVLHDVAAWPRWLVERRLWLDEGGLLVQWLDNEITHLKKGWTVIAEEISFKDLHIPGLPFTLKGRLDRIDYHRDHGVICWDYKSGSSPGKNDVLSHLTSPQLPIYLMALQRGSLSGLESTCEKRPLSAGYIQLKSPGEVGMTILGGEDFNWETPLLEWGNVFRNIGDVLCRGSFIPHPYPFSRLEKPDEICTACRHRTLCERGLVQDSIEKDEEFFT